MTTQEYFINFIKKERYYSEHVLNSILVKYQGIDLISALNTYIVRLMELQANELDRLLEKRYGIRSV